MHRQIEPKVTNIVWDYRKPVKITLPQFCKQKLLIKSIRWSGICMLRIFGKRESLGISSVFFLFFFFTLMPIPSASSKIIFTTFKFFWACSIFFKCSQIFWSWPKARFYLINLHIWAWSKLFEHIQKILNTVKNIWTWSKNIWTSRWIRHMSSQGRK